MQDSLKDKIKKISELILRGATEGERAAAEKALHRIMMAHNIQESELTRIYYKDYQFRFVSNVEKSLLTYLIHHFVPNSFKSAIHDKVKTITISLQYAEWVTLDCAYEYFRRHMKKQYQKAVVPQLKKCRKAKTRNRLRSQLDGLFIQRYVIESNLIDQKYIVSKKATEMSHAERLQRLLMEGVEGGSYKKQVSDIKLIEY